MTTWDKLHNSETLYGKRVGKVDKLGNTNGLPDQPTLNALLNKAQGLSLAEVRNGMSFTWATATVLNGTVTFSSPSPLSNTNKTAATCHEDHVFPVDPGSNLHLVIRQSVAPCTRCRAAFRAWAKERASSIIVSADTGYDSSPDNTVFIFTRTGAAYQWS